MAMTSGDEELDIADWLLAIHLERYKDSFRQHGYHKVRDILSLDNESLQHIGVGATGHRKRIISRLRHISGETSSVSPPGSVEKADSQEFSNRDEQDNDAGHKNSTSGKITATESIVKPVPKPRTVFNKIAAVKEFAAAVTSTNMSPVCLDNQSDGTKKPSMQETTVPRGSGSDSENSCIGLKPGGVEMEAVTPKYTSAGAGKPFHPISSLPARQNKETLQPGSSYQQYKSQMEADTIQRSPLSISPSFAGSREEVTSFSTSPPSPQETLTMISNEIYSGFGPRTGSFGSAADTAAPQKHLNPLDMIRQETTSAPERIKSPQMRSSTPKPAQMRNTPSPNPGWIQDGVSPRPPPVGISASPTTSRLRITASVRPVPVGNQAHLLPNQKRSNVTATFSAVSLRPNPVGDSGSPRLPRTGQVAFPRPPPIGHSASPMLPSGRISPLQNSTKDTDNAIPLPNSTSTRQGKNKQSTVQHETMGITPRQRTKSITKNTFLRPEPGVKSNSRRSSEIVVNDISQRPTPVGNAGSSSVPSTKVPSQKSFLLRYTTPKKSPAQKSASGSHSGPLKPVSSTQTDVLEQDYVKISAPVNCHVSKRPTTLGISPSSTLKKSFLGKSVPNVPLPKTAVSTLPCPKSKVGDFGLPHHRSPEIVPMPKTKTTGCVPRTNSIGNATTQKAKVPKSDLSVRPTEGEQYPTEKTKVKGSKFSLKQKPAEKCGLSIQKSSGSVSFQRPKQTGNTGSQPPKCRNVVSSIKNSPPSGVLQKPQGNAEVKKPLSNAGISLSKVIKNIPSARPKQKDITVPNTAATRPQPVGNISSTASKSSTVSLNCGKPSEGIVRTPPKTIASHLLPRLPFIQKKSTPKMSLVKPSISRAGGNNYLVCSPGRKPVHSVTEPEEENDLNHLQDVPPFEDSLDLQKTYTDSWEMNLTEESLEAALRANAATFKPIQDEHLVLVRPRLLGSHFSDAFIEQKYWSSKTKEG